MCGIGAILYKNEKASAPVGKHLVSMLQAMRHRGSDSTGVTVAGQDIGSDGLLVMLRMVDHLPVSEMKDKIVAAVANEGATVDQLNPSGQHLRLVVKGTSDVRRLADSLRKVNALQIDSIGTNSSVVKDVGDAESLDRKHAISSLNGVHGIGHVRLATESIVDVTHSHPFWAYPFPDITVVHNGQLTNYRGLKRIYEAKGHHFQTHNDSELIAVYLADKLAQGEKLNDALTQSLADLDGSFTYVVSTRNGLGFAKEKWSFKPLVLMERDDVVAVASEEVALRRVFPEEIDRLEPQENEVMTWQTSM